MRETPRRDSARLSCLDEPIRLPETSAVFGLVIRMILWPEKRRSQKHDDPDRGEQRERDP
jgi:hypothetical protein